MIVGDVVDLSSINFTFLFREADIIPGYAGGFHVLGRDDPAIVADGVWLETSMTGREGEDSPVARVGVGRDGNAVLVDVLPRDDLGSALRYCVSPSSPLTYDPVPDPAVPCFADADGAGCGVAPRFVGVSPGDVYTVEILAVRGSEFSRVGEGFDLSVAGSGSGAGALVSHGSGVSPGILTVELTLLRELSEVAVLERVVSVDADGNPVLDGEGNTVYAEVETGTTRAGSATLRVTPESGLPADLVVEFARGDVRRGLHFQQLGSGVCSDLGTGWRLPNFAEAAGLLWDGDDVTLRASGRVDVPGLSGAGAGLSLGRRRRLRGTRGLWRLM